MTTSNSNRTDSIPADPASTPLSPAEPGAPSGEKPSTYPIRSAARACLSALPFVAFIALFVGVLFFPATLGLPPVLAVWMGVFFGALFAHWMVTTDVSRAMEAAQTTSVSLGLRVRTRTGGLVLRRLLEMTEELERVSGEHARIRTQYDLITTNIAASIIISDVTGSTVFCNPYTSVLTGYGTDEICRYDGDFVRSIVHEDDLPRYERARRVSGLAEDISVKYRIIHRSGLTIWLETRLVPVFDDLGALAATMSVSIDVTDSLAYQRQIEEQNRDLSDFASMVSHDLKAPIFTIKGMAAALLEDHGEALGGDGRALIEYIADATIRLERLVGSVLEYSAISVKDAPAQSISIDETIRNVLADFGELIKTKKAIVTIEPNLPQIVANPVRLYQVFSNLIGNALKYSSPDRPPEIAVTRRPATGGALILDIKDNGLGIPASKIADIFRPYHRAHGNQIEGSGVGLACVKKIMELFGGGVTVSSVEGKGSKFTLTFPPPTPKPREIPAELQRCFDR